MKVSFRNKRRIYKLKKRFESKIVLNPRELKVIQIVKKQVSKPDADLITAPLSHNRYITSGDKHLTIILTGENAIISNHKFHYDISLSKDAVKILNSKFDKILESRRRIAERDILNHMLDSLTYLSQ